MCRAPTAETQRQRPRPGSWRPYFPLLKSAKSRRQKTGERPPRPRQEADRRLDTSEMLGIPATTDARTVIIDERKSAQADRIEIAARTDGARTIDTSASHRLRGACLARRLARPVTAVSVFAEIHRVIAMRTGTSLAMSRRREARAGVLRNLRKIRAERDQHRLTLLDTSPRTPCLLGIPTKRSPDRHLEELLIVRA